MATGITDNAGLRIARYTNLLNVKKVTPILIYAYSTQYLSGTHSRAEYYLNWKKAYKGFNLHDKYLYGGIQLVKVHLCLYHLGPTLCSKLFIISFIHLFISRDLIYIALISNRLPEIRANLVPKLNESIANIRAPNTNILLNKVLIIISPFFKDKT